MAEKSDAQLFLKRYSNNHKLLKALLKALSQNTVEYCYKHLSDDGFFHFPDGSTIVLDEKGFYYGGKV